MGLLGASKKPWAGGVRDYQMRYNNLEGAWEKKTLGGRETRPCLAQRVAGE
jgi:hypothetical protein